MRSAAPAGGGRRRTELGAGDPQIGGFAVRVLRNEPPTYPGTDRGSPVRATPRRSGCRKWRGARKAGDGTVDKKRSALIVASGDYTDPGLKRLRAPVNDARALAAVLRDPEIGGFEVQTLLNEPAHEVNLALEEFFADRQPGDLLLVHFSCHGIKDEDGELCFAMANTLLRGWGRPRWRPSSSTGG